MVLFLNNYSSKKRLTTQKKTNLIYLFLEITKSLINYIVFSKKEKKIGNIKKS